MESRTVDGMRHAFEEIYAVNLAPKLSEGGEFELHVTNEYSEDLKRLEMRFTWKGMAKVTIGSKAETSYR